MNLFDEADQAHLIGPYHMFDRAKSDSRAAGTPKYITIYYLFKEGVRMSTEFRFILLTIVFILTIAIGTFIIVH